jgi:AcrR family transcriptional regulator
MITVLVDQVAERAGVRHASLYRRYTSEHALPSPVCERGTTQTREAALAALRALGDPWDALAGFFAGTSNREPHGSLAYTRPSTSSSSRTRPTKRCGRR